MYSFARCANVATCRTARRCGLADRHPDTEITPILSCDEAGSTSTLGLSNELDCPYRPSTKSAEIRRGAEPLPELQESIAADALAVEKRMKDKQLGNADHPGSVPYLLRLPAVLRTTGLGRSTLYRLISERAFPPPVKLARRAVAWRQEEVQRWASARVPAAHRQGSGG